jgi:hypothetical protein
MCFSPWAFSEIYFTTKDPTHWKVCAPTILKVQVKIQQFATDICLEGWQLCLAM